MVRMDKNELVHLVDNRLIRMTGVGARVNARPGIKTAPAARGLHPERLLTPRNSVPKPFYGAKDCANAVRVL
jgi:hypothetical protein